MALRLVVLGAALWLFAGCAAKKPLSADEYFNDGTAALEDGGYPLAVEKFRALLDHHPFSPYSEEAELKIAHAHYLNGSCPEAVAAFTDFQRRHPTSPHLPFVAYLIGRCYQRQMRPPDRDQSASQNAHAYYVAVLQQYPDSPYADLARLDMQYCRNHLAQQELLVAGFYSRRGNARAAEYRLLDLVNRFNDTDVAGEALYELGALYRDRGDSEKAALAFAAVVHHHAAHAAAARAAAALERLQPQVQVVSGDPLLALRAQSGRSRALALAQITEVPPLETPPVGALAPGALPGGQIGSGGPFGY
jgi:outer membrane protein assembly factor BamD